MTDLDRAAVALAAKDDQNKAAVLEAIGMIGTDAAMQIFATIETATPEDIRGMNNLQLQILRGLAILGMAEVVR